MPRHGEEIWAPALIFLLLVGAHLFAARVGNARRAAVARKRARRATRRRTRSHEHLLSNNDPIEPE